MVISTEENVYTLEFSRDTVAMAERMGFNRDDAGDKMMTRIPELFFFAFMMHHPQISRKKTNSILFDDLGGLTTEQIERLVDLFDNPYDELLNKSGTPKNPKVTVTL